MGFISWNEIDKLYYLAQVNMGKASSWKERRLRSKIRLIVMFPYAIVVGTANKMRGIRASQRMLQHPIPKYHLAVTVIVKNEGPYIAEWCAWHRLIGVDCIIVYDNDSTDDTHQVLKPFIDSGFVIYNTINGRARQMDAYNDAIKRYGQLCRYMAIIDCDEFLQPLCDGKTLNDIVDSAFASCKNIGGIGVNWAIFGSSGQMTKTPGLVTERFTHRSEPTFANNRHIKSIVRPECVVRFPNPHFAYYRTGFYCINMQGDFVRGSFSDINEGWHRLRLVHYYCKSKEEHMERCKKGYADSKKGQRPVNDIYTHDRNDIFDTTLSCRSNEIRKLLVETHGKEYVSNL